MGRVDDEPAKASHDFQKIATMSRPLSQNL
jgi:hypothetical protein